MFIATSTQPIDACIFSNENATEGSLIILGPGLLSPVENNSIELSSIQKFDWRMPQPGELITYQDVFGKIRTETVTSIEPTKSMLIEHGIIALPKQTIAIQVENHSRKVKIRIVSLQSKYVILSFLFDLQKKEK